MSTFYLVGKYSDTGKPDLYCHINSDGYSTFARAQQALAWMRIGQQFSDAYAIAVPSPVKGFMRCIAGDFLGEVEIVNGARTPEAWAAFLNKVWP